MPRLLKLSLTMTILLWGSLSFAQDDPVGQASADSKSLAEKGLVAASMGDFEGALPLFIQADLSYPRDPVVVYSIARCYEETGYCGEARAYFIKALAHPSGLPEKPRKIAMDYILVSGDCAASMDDAARVAAEEADVLHIEGISFFLAGDLDGAMGKLEEAFSRTPSAELALRMAQIKSLKGAACEDVRASLVLAGGAGLLSGQRTFFDTLAAQVEGCGAAIAVVERAPRDKPFGETKEIKEVNEGGGDKEEAERDVLETLNPHESESALSHKVEKPETSWLIYAGVGAGVVGLASIGAATYFLIHGLDLQDQLDNEVTRDHMDLNKVGGLKADMRTNEELFNAFLWGGLGLALLSSPLLALGAPDGSVSAAPWTTASSGGLVITFRR